MTRSEIESVLWKPSSKQTVQDWRASQGNGCDDSKGAERAAGRCTLPGSTYFLPFLCPPRVERTRRGLAGALRVRSSVGVALGLSGCFVRSRLTAHTSPPHTLATGHGALQGREDVSGSFGSLAGGRGHQGRAGHRPGDGTPNPMTCTAITGFSNFQWKGPRKCLKSTASLPIKASWVRKRLSLGVISQGNKTLGQWKRPGDIIKRHSVHPRVLLPWEMKVPSDLYPRRLEGLENWRDSCTQENFLADKNYNSRRENHWRFYDLISRIIFSSLFFFLLLFLEIGEFGWMYKK